MKDEGVCSFDLYVPRLDEAFLVTLAIVAGQRGEERSIRYAAKRQEDPVFSVKFFRISRACLGKNEGFAYVVNHQLSQVWRHRRRQLSTLENCFAMSYKSHQVHQSTRIVASARCKN